MGFQLGIEKLLSEAKLKGELRGKRVALMANPASVDQNLRHSFDLVAQDSGIEITAAFGPQHGIRGEKQDNMIESDDFLDSKHGVPVYSLYGKVRRPTPEMLDAFDVLLFDLQDIGTRIYTYLTTLVYLLEDIQNQPDKELWVLDRPNPAGRIVEGPILLPEFETFVGAAPTCMRHGMTLGELANWYVQKKSLNSKLRVIPMEGYKMGPDHNHSWPGLPWVNPSPNLPRLTTAPIYPGTVLIEGTELSEGRGTTLPLEVFGAPDLCHEKIFDRMREEQGDWLKGCKVRPCYFEPTFQKHSGKLVNGVQIHVDHQNYDPSHFKPFRLISLYFRSVSQVYPNFELWKKPPYEYEKELMPVDMLSGSDFLRCWAEDGSRGPVDLDLYLQEDEHSWEEERQKHLIYPSN